MIKVMIVGQKWLAGQLLKHCLDEHDIKVIAVSPPSMEDRLALLANKHNIPVTIHGNKLSQTQVPIDVEVILTAHAYCFVTKSARDKTKYGAVGYHPSLLPAYKGKTAIADTLANCETVTGGSLYRLDDGWDTGNVLLQRSIVIDGDDTVISLWRDKLAPLGLDLFQRYLGTLL